MIRRIAALAAAFILLAAAPPVRVPPAQIESENARWTAIGAKLPPGGIVLPEPYAAPYSTRSFIVPYSWYSDFYSAFKAKHDVPVSASALRADLPVLRLLLEKVYAGYAPAAQRGWNWNAWLAQWDRSLAARGSASLPLVQAFAPWGKLEDVQLDNHSGVPELQTFTSGSSSAVLAARPSGACMSISAGGKTFSLSKGDLGQQPHAVKSWNGTAFANAWYISYPKREAAARSVRCGGHDVALHAVETTSGDPAASYQTIGDGIAYVRMPAFTDAAGDALRAALAKATGLGKERAVIFDLRGNQGGNAPTDLLSNWFAQSAVDNASELTQQGTTSCFRTALFFNLQQQLAAGVKPPYSAQLAQFAQAIVDTLKAPVSCTVERADTKGITALRDHRLVLKTRDPSQTRVIALVDNLCGSDCEYMAAVLAGLPGTVIAGSSTYGVMGFTQPGYFVLPHSRVPFRLALSRTDAYGDERSVDGYGISVDVLLPDAASQSRASLTALAKALL